MSQPNTQPATRSYFEANLNSGGYTYEIKSSANAQRLTIDSDGKGNYTLRHAPPDGTDSQRFLFRPDLAAAGYFRLQPLSASVGEFNFITVKADGTVVSARRAGDDSQRFHVEWQGDQTFALREPTKGQWLEMGANGAVLRSPSGTTGPTPEQLFQLMGARFQWAFPGFIEAQLNVAPSAVPEFIQSPSHLQSIVATDTWNFGLHINGMAITGENYLVVNLPVTGREFGVLLWWKDGQADWKTWVFAMVDHVDGEDRYSAGMQAVDDLVAVADNKYIRFFGMRDTAVEYDDFQFNASAWDAEWVGMERHPELDCIYLVTLRGMWRSPPGEPYLIAANKGTSTDLVPNPRFRFKQITRNPASLAMDHGEAGLALMFDNVAGNFVCLSLGTDQLFKLKAYRIDLDADGTTATFTEVMETELTAPSGVGPAGASFRWAGTARLLHAEGRLEIYASPRNLSSPVGDFSHPVRWRFPIPKPRQFLAPTSLPTDRYYRLTTMFMGEDQSLDVENAGDKSQVILAKTADVSGQYWRLQYVGDAFYRLTTLWQGDQMSLELYAGRNVVLATTNPLSTTQLWKFSALRNGFYRLTNRYAGDDMGLDIQIAAPNPKPAMRLTADTTGQHWKLTQTARPT